MNKHLFMFVLFFLGTNVLLAQKKVSGVVKEADTNEPLIGATVVVKGTTNGVITDLDGHYTIDVNANDVLQFAYVGLETHEETVGERTVINVSLASSSVKINEVVVTAMGLERKAKSLTYATQQVGGGELTRAKETNLINSLQGKTAGLVITPNSTGAGGSSKLLIRGNKSAQGNNQPLIVIDGIPMANSTTTQMEGEYGGRDGGDALSNLNPDDIASINVLKGASAAALYGSMAANGVVMITTKKGAAGSMRVDVSSNTTFETPLDAPKLQSTYGAVVSGSGALAQDSWGEKISGEAKGANRLDEFFRTGMTSINSVSISGGSEKNQSYVSYANTSASGIMPTNTFTRHNMMAKETFKLFDNKVTVNASLNYIIQKGRNRHEPGQYRNPLTGLYTFPANGDFRQYKNEFEKYDEVKGYPVQQWYREVNQDFSANPYWVLHRNPHTEKRDRMMASASIRYNITDYLNIQGRLNYDRIADLYERKIYASTSTTLHNVNGEYRQERDDSRQFYGDLMANFNKTFDAWSVTASIGTSFTDLKETGVSLATSGDVYIPNFFHLANGSKNGVGNKRNKTQKRLNSVFGTAQIGYKDMLYLDVTGRNDWSSTLSYTPNVSYFYPSFGLTALINEMTTLPEAFNLLKARASYSIVGNDVPAYTTNPTHEFSNGSVKFNTAVPFTEMKPEKLKSLEFGFDLSMFDNRFEMDFTYYKTNNTNQYFVMSVPAATGFSRYYFNAGDIQNSGFETTMSWRQPITADLSWKTSFNLSYNDNVIKKLDNRTGIKESDRLTYVSLGSIMGYDMRLLEGGSYGDIYSKTIQRKDGVITVDKDGVPQFTNDFEKVGNVNSKWNLGWSNSFNYKDMQLYFLIDGRIGGNFIDATQAVLDTYGVSKNSADARDNGGVDIGNGTKVDAAKFYQAVGYKGVGGGYYVYSATNFRLRELSIGYAFRNLLGAGKDLGVSLIGRNLFFFYKDSPSDPEVSMSTSNGYSGSNYFALPATRSFGINLKATF
ncbi:MAG: SusC/RagA family TonB-linked outer membrane protein [Tannerella sp.]|uniref:SusC/RagA family TonB-linked outer membrane protein n=1 Tax=Tannerella sp. TaxID=2382127 RepID=UPI003FA2AB62